MLSSANAGQVENFATASKPKFVTPEVCLSGAGARGLRVLRVRGTETSHNWSLQTRWRLTGAWMRPAPVLEYIAEVY